MKIQGLYWKKSKSVDLHGSNSCCSRVNCTSKRSKSKGLEKYYKPMFTVRQEGGRQGQFSSVQFSRSVMSDSLRPHELQHTRPPCPSPTPGVHSDPRPSSWWYHPAISSSVIPFSSCPQSLPASESFPMSQLFTCDGQSTGVSALASFLPKNTQDWSPLEWTCWISLLSEINYSWWKPPEETSWPYIKLGAQSYPSILEQRVCIFA